MTMQWRGADEMAANCMTYADKVYQACVAVGNYIAPIMETYAKQNASWVDRTGNARQGLHAWVEETSKEIVTIFLSHGVFYGRFLEVVRAGELAIIWPTIQAHVQQIFDMLQGIFA